MPGCPIEHTMTVT